MSNRPTESDDSHIERIRKLRDNYDKMLAIVRDGEKATTEIANLFVREGKGDAGVTVVCQLVHVSSQLSAITTAVYQGIDLMLAAEQRRARTEPGWDLPKPSAD